MNDTTIHRLPDALESIEATTQKIGFPMASDRQTGSLLRTLAASKPGGRMLELGTGTGLSACWLLDGMSQDAILKSVDNDAKAVSVAMEYIGTDPRVDFTIADGGEFLKALQVGEPFDLIFADTWPGKYHHLDLALNLLKKGGCYVIDDMLPQPNWPDDHPPKVKALLHTLENLDGYHLTSLCWSTGIVLLVKE